jgi:hypothetical protein
VFSTEVFDWVKEIRRQTHIHTVSETQFQNNKIGRAGYTKSYPLHLKAKDQLKPHATDLQQNSTCKNKMTQRKPLPPPPAIKLHAQARRSSSCAS